MERVVVVETLGRRGEVTERVRLTSFPAVIGRAWTSDVIVADPLVEPRHAVLTADAQGALVIEDLGSTNGLFADGGAQRTPRVVLSAPGTVRLGRTVLRIAAAEWPVAPAVREAAPTGVIAQLLARPRAMAAVSALGLGLTGFNAWLGDYSGKTTTVLADDLLGIVGLVLVWAGVWALAGRLIVQQARFWKHVTVTWLLLLVMGVWDVAAAYLVFLFPSQRVVPVLGVLVGVAAGLVLLTLQAGLASAAPRGRRVAFAAAAVASLMLLVWVGSKADGDRLDRTVRFTATVRPVPASLIPAGSLDDFLGATSEMVETLDTDAKLR